MRACRAGPARLGPCLLLVVLAGVLLVGLPLDPGRRGRLLGSVTRPLVVVTLGLVVGLGRRNTGAGRRKGRRGGGCGWRAGASRTGQGAGRDRHGMNIRKSGGLGAGASPVYFAPGLELARVSFGQLYPFLISRRLT